MVLFAVIIRSIQSDQYFTFIDLLVINTLRSLIYSRGLEKEKFRCVLNLGAVYLNRWSTYYNKSTISLSLSFVYKATL